MDSKANLLETCFWPGSLMFGGYLWHLGALTSCRALSSPILPEHQNLATLASAVPDKLLQASEQKMGRVTLTKTFLGGGISYP